MTTTTGTYKPLITRQDRLDSLNEEYKQLGLIHHLQYGRRFVPGTGSTKPVIVFVGSSPTDEENRAAHSGAGCIKPLLIEMLGMVGMSMEHVYITHLLKYQTRENREPRDLEAAASFPVLKREIGILKPQIVVPWGRYMTKAFVPNARMEHHHGHVFQRKNFSIIPMFHPAITQRSPGLRKIIFSDFHAVVRALASNS